MSRPAEPVPVLVGMVHLQPLPGSPRFTGHVDDVIEDAVARASTLTRAGFSALMIENFGDVPFFGGSVPPETIAGITRAVTEIRMAVDDKIHLGVNVLRNDGVAAVAIAGATGASLVRINVLSGSMNTDQGPIVGQAAEVARSNARLGTVEIWADVFVKHATPPPGLTIEQATADTVERSLADVVVISGSGTGHAPPIERLATVRGHFPDIRLAVGSGVTADNVAAMAEHADHLIVGTALEEGGRPGAAVDEARLGAFLDAAARAGAR